MSYMTNMSAICCFVRHYVVLCIKLKGVFIMRKILLILLACMILLCSCKYNYIGELPDGITQKTMFSDVIDKLGESNYTDTRPVEDAKMLVYDYETQYGKCLLEFIFDKKTNKLGCVSYIYYGDQKEMIQLLNLISDDMKGKYGNYYNKLTSLDDTADIYKEDHDYDFVYVSYTWHDESIYDDLYILYTHQFNHNRLPIKELPSCETTVQIDVIL